MQKMKLYDINGEKSLCPYCVTLSLYASMWGSRGHQEDCPIMLFQKHLERAFYENTPRLSADSLMKAIIGESA